MAKNKELFYRKISSFLPAPTGFNYLDKNKNPHFVNLPGKTTPKDKPPPPVYITDEEYEELIKPEHGGHPSPFTILIEKGPDKGIIAQKVSFADLPASLQKERDPEAFKELEAARRKLVADELRKDDAEVVE